MPTSFYILVLDQLRMLHALLSSSMHSCYFLTVNQTQNDHKHGKQCNNQPYAVATAWTSYLESDLNLQVSWHEYPSVIPVSVLVPFLGRSTEHWSWTPLVLMWANLIQTTDLKGNIKIRLVTTGGAEDCIGRSIRDWNSNLIRQLDMEVDEVKTFVATSLTN